ncbi:hypothetical protein [Paracoccus sp. (in: a-proteobacteria)]|uniref:hypothetical protein n=1 Tax=Paracoccus sp. TaxID=267 RepID=UPI003A867CD3
MVTAVTAFANSNAVELGANVVPAQEPQEQPNLSDFAQATLDRLSAMHESYAASMAEVNTSLATRPQPAREVDQLAAAMNAAAESNRVAMQLQAQVVHFQMASSISNTLSSQLNSFLKGT